MKKGEDPEPDPYLLLMDLVLDREAQKHVGPADPDPRHPGLVLLFNPLWLTYVLFLKLTEKKIGKGHIRRREQEK